MLKTAPIVHILLLGFATFLVAWLVSLLCLTIIRKYAHSWGLVDIPNERKVHQRIMPKGGGIGMIIGVSISGLFCWLCLHHFSDDFRFVPNSNELFQSFAKDAMVILLGGFIIFLTGLVDDVKNLTPKTKLILESLVAFWIIYNDIRITVFVENYFFSLAITWFWIVLITNSFNLLDNMDGLSAGVAFISGLIFVMVAVQIQQWPIVLFLMTILGAVLAFLCYNFPPASMFMGDSGSLFLGYMMSVLTIHATFYQQHATFSIGIPILVLAVPLFDTSTVVFLRWKQNTPIFKADKRHFSHRLVNLGLSQHYAVLLIYLVTFTTGISALLLYQLELWAGILVLVQIISVLSLIHILEQLGNHNHVEK